MNKENYIPISFWNAMMDTLMAEYEKDRDEKFLNLYYDMKFSQKAWHYGSSMYLDNCSKEFLKNLNIERVEREIWREQIHKYN